MMQHTRTVTRQLVQIPPQRFRDKLGRTVLAVALGYVILRYGQGWSAWLRDGALVTVGLTLAGEWFLFPLRAGLALVKDAAEAVAKFRSRNSRPPPDGFGQ